jgi:hypothetical protein
MVSAMASRSPFYTELPSTIQFPDGRASVNRDTRSTQSSQLSSVPARFKRSSACLEAGQWSRLERAPDRHVMFGLLSAARRRDL